MSEVVEAPVKRARVKSGADFDKFVELWQQAHREGTGVIGFAKLLGVDGAEGRTKSYQSRASGYRAALREDTVNEDGSVTPGLTEEEVQRILPNMPRGGGKGGAKKQDLKARAKAMLA